MSEATPEAPALRWRNVLLLALGLIGSGGVAGVTGAATAGLTVDEWILQIDERHKEGLQQVSEAIARVDRTVALVDDRHREAVNALRELAHEHAIEFARIHERLRAHDEQARRILDELKAQRETDVQMRERMIRLEAESSGGGDGG